MKDDHILILDYLPKGKSEVPAHKRKPIAQGVGDKYFSLLEVSPRSGVSFEVGERVYIGEEARDKVDHIERRIKYDWLTPTAKSELPVVLEKIVQGIEERFINFYNTCGIISPRQHKLEVLPKIGKRHRQDILDERGKQPFKSFDDMRRRLKNVPDPAKVIVEKIIEEIKGKSKYYIFVQMMQQDMGRRAYSGM